MSAPQVDFRQVKEAASVEQVTRFLELTLKPHGDTLRGTCHLCKASDQRAFVITVSKKLFHCFKCKAGGDMLKLVAESKAIPVRQAAVELAKFCGVEPARATSSANSSPSPDKKGFDAEKYAAGLDASHEALQPLGLSAETFKEWKAGYASSGVLRGKLALPIPGREGAVVGYVGRTLKDETPVLQFPNGLAPTEYIFGADRVTGGELFLVRDPIDVLKAFESGVENCVAFLTEGISSAQLQYLSVLMDEKKIETLTLF